MYLLVFPFPQLLYILYDIFEIFASFYLAAERFLHRDNTSDCKASKNDRKSAMDEARSIVPTDGVAAVKVPKDSRDNVENDGTLTHLS